MKKKQLVIIVGFLLSFTLLMGHTSADSKAKSISFKLPYNQAISYLFQNEVFVKGNSKKFNINNFDITTDQNTFINFNADITPLNDKQNEIQGVGVVHINGKSYPFSVNDTINSYQLSDDKTLYFGDIAGTLRNETGDDVFILSLHYIPESNEQEIVITSGTLDSENGVGAIPFGKEFLTKEMIDLVRTP